MSEGPIPAPLLNQLVSEYQATLPVDKGVSVRYDGRKHYVRPVSKRDLPYIFAASEAEMVHIDRLDEVFAEYEANLKESIIRDCEQGLCKFSW